MKGVASAKRTRHPEQQEPPRKNRQGADEILFALKSPPGDKVRDTLKEETRKCNSGS